MFLLQYNDIKSRKINITDIILYTTLSKYGVYIYQVGTNTYHSMNWWNSRNFYILLLVHYINKEQKLKQNMNTKSNYPSKSGTKINT